MNAHLGLPLADALLRLVVATLLGAIVGLERERLERAAGLRTHALVALASALMMLVSAYSFAELAPIPRDPTRMAAQVVSGIGFLGAGVIIFRKNAVRGLTTAASIWAAAGLGLAAGGGLLPIAAASMVLILVIQVGLRPLEQRFFAHHRAHRLELRLLRGGENLAAVERAIVAAGVQLRGLRVRPARGGREDRLELDLGPTRDSTATALLDTLRKLDGVRLVAYTLGTTRPLRPAPGTTAEMGAADDDDEIDEELDDSADFR
ncbi:MAG TPA: MgtC/SapB family protein [Thermomicrobiales bacterium]|jgi:putative Mg2+ transporter-C (MgtC) family protein